MVTPGHQAREKTPTLTLRAVLFPRPQNPQGLETRRRKTGPWNGSPKKPAGLGLWEKRGVRGSRAESCLKAGPQQQHPQSLRQSQARPVPSRCLKNRSEILLRSLSAVLTAASLTDDGGAGVAQESMTLPGGGGGGVITQPVCQGAPHPQAGTAACCRPKASTPQGAVCLEEELLPTGRLEAGERAAGAGPGVGPRWPVGGWALSPWAAGASLF